MSIFICHCYRHILIPKAEVVLTALFPMMDQFRQPGTKSMWLVSDLCELQTKWQSLCEGNILTYELSLLTCTDETEIFGICVGDVEIYPGKVKFRAPLSEEIQEFLEPSKENWNEACFETLAF
jgi:hypothetical protein